MMLVFIASPYTSPDKKIMELRYQMAMKFTAEAFRHGALAFSPIVHCHKMAKQYSLPKDIDFWQEYSKVMVAVADLVLVLGIPGWEASAGVKLETDYAKSISTEVIVWVPSDENMDFEYQAEEFWKNWKRAADERESLADFSTESVLAPRS